jgi:signal transduction histidine kinase/DNA-binding response OmpR family regulator
MGFFRNLSIRSKLMFITMMVSTISLLTASGVFLVKDIVNLRRELLEKIGTDADMVSRNITAALSFQNQSDADDTLSALRADDSVDAAWTFTPDGKIFATYFRDASFPTPDASFIHRSEPLLTRDFFQICRPVALNGQIIGAVVVRSNLLELNQRYHDYIHVIVLVISLASLIALILVMRLQRAVSRPILDLAATAKAVSTEKNFAMRAQAGGGAELGELVDCFNQMLEEIQQRDEQLKAHRDHLEDEVEIRTDELRSVAKDLLVAKDRAEQASRAKSSFLANMSHEIRTPMTAIVGYADMMLDPDQTRSDRQDCLQVIRRNGAHLLDLINDILDLSKIEADKMTVERIDVDVRELIAEVASLTRPRVVEKGLRFEVNFSDPIPKTIQTDSLRLKQVMVNLLGNAVKFTATGRICLNVSCSTSIDDHSNRIRFAIVDTGIGIDQEQMSRLFQSFSQADESMTRRFGGTGLGLTISKRLSRLLGGDITVASTMGVGTTFTAEIDPGPLKNVEMLYGVTEAVIVPQAKPLQAMEIKLNARILFAEDGIDNQRLISTYLRKAGADVTIAPNGKVAVDLMCKEKFDLVLMDMQMPVLDGYGAASKLREMGCKHPIIALTAHAMAEDRGKCIAAGCTDYLTKPIERERLLTTVASYLSNSQPSSTPAPTPAPTSTANAHAGAYESDFASDPEMRDLVDEYVQRLPEEVSKLVSLLQDQQIEPLRRVAHQLKGSGGGYGFGKITELAAVADKSIKESAPIDRLRTEIDSLISYIRGIRGYDLAKETANASERSNH